MNDQSQQSTGQQRPAGDGQEMQVISPSAAREESARLSAVFVAHGMGQQRKFETLDLIASGLRNYDIEVNGKSENIPEAITIDSGDGYLHGVKLRLNRGNAEREVHIFEGYWAPLAEGAVNLRELMAFLVGAGFNGLAKTGRPFIRFLFNTRHSFPADFRVTILLLTAMLVVAALVIMNTAIVTVAALSSPLSNDPAWLKGLRPDLTTLFNLFLIVAGAFGLIILRSYTLRSRVGAGDGPGQESQKEKSLARRRRLIKPSIALFIVTIVTTIACGLAIPLLFYGHVYGRQPQPAYLEKAFGALKALLGTSEAAEPQPAYLEKAFGAGLVSIINCAFSLILLLVVVVLLVKAWGWVKTVLQQSFKITEQSLTSLKTEGVPDDVLKKLKRINQEVKGKEQFLARLRTEIGDEQTVRFESLILKHALQQRKNAPSSASFKITEQSLTSLKTEGVPDDILKKLQRIKNREVKGKEQFLALLRTTIGDEQTVRFESLILKHAPSPNPLPKSLLWGAVVVMLAIILLLNIPLIVAMPPGLFGGQSKFTALSSSLWTSMIALILRDHSWSAFTAFSSNLWATLKSVCDSLSGLSWPLLIVVSWYVRGLLVQYVGDVAVYVASHKLDRFNSLRDNIRKTVYTAAEAVYKAPAAPAAKDDGIVCRQANEFAYDKVFIVGHSLGAVVVYDALNRLINETELRRRKLNEDKASGRELNEDELRALKQNVAGRKGPDRWEEGRTKLLLTFGSPQDKIAFLFARPESEKPPEKLQDTGSKGTGTGTVFIPIREALAAAAQPLVQSAEFRQFEWINIYSKQDIISGPLDFFDPPLGEGSGHVAIPVQNWEDEEACTLLAAHVEYWDNSKLRQILHEQITKNA